MINIHLLEGASQTMVSAAAADGTHAASNLRFLCNSILEGSEDGLDHPFYAQAKEKIDGCPVPFQERATRQNYYFALLAGDYIAYAAGEYEKRQHAVIQHTLDNICLVQLHEKINEYLGETGSMELLDLLFQQCFLLTAPMQAFMQEMVNELVLSLIYQDIESCKRVFQLL